jgi:serine/threonine protein kinase
MYEMRDKRPSAELLAAVAEHEAAEKAAASADPKKASSATTPVIVVPTPTVPPTTAANIHADAPRKQDSRSVQFATPPKAPSAVASSSRSTPVHDTDDDLASSLPNQPIFRDQRAKLVHSVTDFLPPSPSSSDDRGGAFALLTRAFKGGKKPATPPLDARYVLDFFSKTSPVRLLGEIGRGGSMAIVYRACISDFMVACKSYDLEVTDEIAREALLREFRIVRSLAPHDNIIPYFALDQVSSPTHWRLYMPLYDMTLRQLLNESRACAMSRRASAVDDSSAAWTSFNAQLLSIASTSSVRRTQTNNNSMLRVLTVLERIEAASQVAAALSHAHASQVLHRDVKAENVLVRLGVDELVQCVLCDFGEARELPKAAGLERSMSCFPEADHELLTARGFMSLADVEAVTKRGEPLPLVASFDAVTEQLVYDAPRAVVLNDTTPALIEFVSSTGGNDCIGLLATPNHDMLVRRGGSFAKVAAERLVGQRVEVMTGARRGAGGCGAQLRGRAECRALGDALARGTAASLPDWVWQLSTDALRCVFDAAGKSVVVSSVALRDDLVRAAMHAGLSASFVADAGAWRVTIVSAAAAAVSVARVDEASIVSRKSARSWCFSMPRGHVVVRRVVRDECGRVLQAMLPTIQGNSNVGTSEFMAPETISTTGVRRMAYDEKSDMFSYGMLLFELITNEIPFRREQVSPFDLLDHIKARARPEMPHGVVNSHTEGLYQLHLDCTQHDPIRRISAQVAYQRSLKLAAAERLSPAPM